jgi:anti-anti-sigma factor
MTASDTRVAVRRRGGAAVLDIVGDIDRDADAPLQRAYDEAVALPGVASVLLNFDGVGYINSTGIAVIVGLLARARKQGLAIGACGLSEHYQHIFSITRLSDFIRVYSDEDSAVGSVPAATGDDGAQGARGGGE